MRLAKCYVFLFLIITTHANANTKTTVEKSGDILEIAIPAISLGTTLIFEDDFSGAKQFLKAFITSELTTEILKKSIHEQRPNGNCCDSFPSGHTSAAFTGAAFIHKRYGWKYAIPGYLAATYVGYTRVHAKKHYTKDVVAGAIIGITSSYIFTKKYKGVRFTPYANSTGVGLQIDGKF